MQHFVRHFIIIIAVKYIVLLPCGIYVKIIQIMAKPGAIKLWLPAFFRRHKRGTTRRCAFAAKENEPIIKASGMASHTWKSFRLFICLSFFMFYRQSSGKQKSVLMLLMIEQLFRSGDDFVGIVFADFTKSLLNVLIRKMQY